MTTELETITPPMTTATMPPAESAAMAKIGVDAEVWSTMMKMAKVLAQSALIPVSLQNKPSDVFVVLMKGRAHGLEPMTALENINVIRGKAVMSADCAVGIARASGLCEYFRQIESTKEKATYETKRRGDSQPKRFTFTIEDAKSLGLLDRKGKDGEPNEWQKQTSNMLRKRAKSWLVKDVYEDVLLGIHHETEIDTEAEPEPDFLAEVQAAKTADDLAVVGSRIKAAGPWAHTDELEKAYRTRRDEFKKGGKE
jgi:hypothetical protein